MPLVPESFLKEQLKLYGVAGVSIAQIMPSAAAGIKSALRTQTAGVAQKDPAVPVYDSTWFEIASLSKPIAAVFAYQYFTDRGVSMDTSVNSLLASAGSPFRFKAAAGCPTEWADEVSLTHLVDHTGPQMHYVYGIPRSDTFPDALALISGTADKPAPYGYAALDVKKRPGTAFGYSGGGFLVLQHLLEQREKKPMSQIIAPFLDACGAAVNLSLSFAHEDDGKHYADGFRDSGERVDGGRLNFPPLAAGALGTAAGLAEWLRMLALAYKSPDGCGPITHAAARAVLAHRADLGSEAFMRARMGVGMFVFNVASAKGGDAQPNRWMLHQAANDGFRGVLLVCFDGPDAADGPRGFVVFANGDNNAMLLVASVCRALLSSAAAFDPPLEGLDFGAVPSMEGGFDTTGMKQEEIVNLGFKGLVLQAFKLAP